MPSYAKQLLKELKDCQLHIQMEKYLRGPVYIVHRNHNILTSLNLVVSRKHVINYCTPQQHLPIVTSMSHQNQLESCLSQAQGMYRRVWI
jgi:hypothetical protein